MFTILGIKLTSDQIGWLGARLSRYEPFKSYTKEIVTFLTDYWIELLWVGVFAFIVIGIISRCISVVWQQDESIKDPEAQIYYELEKQSLANLGIICVVWLLVGSFFLYIHPLKEESTLAIKHTEQKQLYRWNRSAFLQITQNKPSTNRIEKSDYRVNAPENNSNLKNKEATTCVNETKPHEKHKTQKNSYKKTSSDDLFDEYDGCEESIVTNREVPCVWCNATGFCPSCAMRANSGISIYAQYGCGMCFGSTICPKCNGLKTVTSTTIRHKDRTTLISGGYISESMGGAGTVVYSPTGKVTAYPSKDCGVSSNHSSISSYDNICERCKGREYESTPYEFAAASTSGARQPYHHHEGTNCPYCRQNDTHYHYPCPACQGSGRQ